MTKTVTTEQMRRIEAAAVKEGIRYARLMENAGAAAARYIRDRFSVKGARAVILCGRGNNGGDGFVIARKLYEAGSAVTVVLTDGKPTTEEASEMFSLLDTREITLLALTDQRDRVNAALDKADFAVDAVYGIGFHGTLPEPIATLFDRINRRQLPVVAVDVPSGLNGDTGIADPHTLIATVTVTFTAIKQGMASDAAAPLCGQIQLLSIGIEPRLVEESFFTLIDPKEELARVPVRAADAHKGSCGHVLSLCGQYGMAGAAFFAAKAALRCGAGLVTAALPQSIYPIVTTMLPEAVYLPLPEHEGHIALPSRARLREQLPRCQAVVIGCGLGVSEEAWQVVADLITHAKCPVVLDADGINMLSLHIDILKTAHAPLVLTPHPGEMARLCGCSVAEVQENRETIAAQWAQKLGVVLVLKGHRTVVATPKGEIAVNTTGNPGMATGGSGDVLAGMIASLIAQGLSPDAAARCGVCLHGLAGDRAAARLSMNGLLPSDLLEELPHLFVQ